MHLMNSERAQTPVMSDDSFDEKLEVEAALTAHQLAFCVVGALLPDHKNAADEVRTMLQVVWHEYPKATFLNIAQQISAKMGRNIEHSYSKYSEWEQPGEGKGKNGYAGGQESTRKPRTICVTTISRTTHGHRADSRHVERYTHTHLVLYLSLIRVSDQQLSAPRSSLLIGYCLLVDSGSSSLV